MTARRLGRRRLDYLPPWLAVALGLALGVGPGLALAFASPVVAGVGFVALLGLAGALAWSGEPIEDLSSRWTSCRRWRDGWTSSCPARSTAGAFPAPGRSSTGPVNSPSSTHLRAATSHPSSSRTSNSVYHGTMAGMVLGFFSCHRDSKEIFMAPQPAQRNARDRSRKTGRIISICLLCAGIGLLFFAVLSAIELVQLRVFGHETPGRVIRQEIAVERVDRREYGRDVRVDIDRYNAIVLFTTNEGTFTISSYYGGTNAPLYPTDSTVTVVYRPGHPERARIQQEISGFRGIFAPLMLVVFGAALIGTAMLLRFLVKKM